MPNTVRAMIIVHGMGSQGRNSSLLGTVRPMLELMEARGYRAKVDARKIEGDLSPDVHASVDITYGEETWRVIEYWWAAEFQAPNPFRVAKWIGLRLWAHLISLIIGIWHGWLDILLPKDPSPRRDPVIARIYHFFAAPTYIFGIAVLIILIPLLASLLVFLRWFALIPGIPSLVGQLHRGLQVFGVDFLGDIYVYFYDEIQSPQIRGGLERLLKDLGKDQMVNHVVLYTHSTGTVIAYDAMANLYQEQGAESTNAIRKVGSFISFGSILNMAWNPRIVEHDRFNKPIPNTIRWFNLWARYDPGAAGPIKQEDKGWLQGVLLANRRVNNSESILLDHTGYWKNQEQVVSLALEELGGPDDKNDFWRGQVQNPDYWGNRSPQAWEDFNTRRGTIAWLALPRVFVLPLALILMLSFYDWAQQIGTFFFLDRINWDELSWFTSALVNDPNWFARIAVPVIIGLIITALAAIPYLLYACFLWKPWANRVRNRRHRDFRDWRGI